MTKSFLVTGGAGFIGGHLVSRLLALGHHVTILDNFSTGSRQTLEFHHGNRKLQVIEGDVRNNTKLRLAMGGKSGVFHLAATVNVQDCIEDWVGSHVANSTATLQVFDQARNLGRIPVVYTSSAAVYGERSHEVCHEGLAERPISPYGADKVACEHHARAFWRVHRLATVGLRLFNVYGPGQSETSPYSGVLARFVRNLRLDRRPVIFGDGLQTRDFVYVDDVVRALTSAMDRINARPGVLISNVCSGRATSLLDVLSLLNEFNGMRTVRPEFRPSRAGDITHSQGDCSCMARELGLHQPISLEVGLTSYMGSLPIRRRVS